MWNDKKNRPSFQIAEAVFVRSEPVTNRDYSENRGHNTDNTNTGYEYIYEYYVNRERYECRGDAFVRRWQAEPKEKDKKITIRYNPEKPQEVIMKKENILGLVAGIICIALTILLIYASTKIDVEL